MTTCVTDEYVAALRAMLTGDGEYGRLSADLRARDGARSGDVISALTGMALCAAARRRFRDGWTNADVVRLVAQARVRFGDVTGDIDPRVAEGTLRGALGDAAAAENLDKTAVAVAVPALLSVVLDQQGISGATEIDAEQSDRSSRWQSLCPASAASLVAPLTPRSLGSSGVWQGSRSP